MSSSIIGLKHFSVPSASGFCFALGILLIVATAPACTTEGDSDEGGVEGITSDGGRGGRDVGSTGGGDEGALDNDDSGFTVADSYNDGPAQNDGSIVEQPDGTPDAEEDIPVSEGGFATIRGTVWAPGNAPGLVPAGQEIPIFDALIYVTDERPEPIPRNAYCYECQDPPRTSIQSDYSGNFTLVNVVPGNHWLVIEKGQFRREFPIIVSDDEVLELTAEETTLPSVQDERFGMTIPRIAMAVGDFDDLEDILGKMGLGSVNASGEYYPESAPGRIDIWQNGGYGFESVAAGTLTQLVTNLDRMLEYHIIFIPCASDSNTIALRSQEVLRNIRDYVEAGGKLYVTDWSGEWMDNVFPESIELGGSGTDTPASAYDGSTDTWNIIQFGDANGSSYDTPNAEAIDEDLNAWLNGQQGPTVYSDTQTTYDADVFEIEGNWNFITNLVTTQIGYDEYGDPVFDEPRTYVVGGSDYEPLPKRPMTVTFEPTGCGRVLYSTYHTTDDTHPGLTPQERVLLYLIMEIGVCRTGKWYD